MAGTQPLLAEYERCAQNRVVSVEQRSNCSPFMQVNNSVGERLDVRSHRTKNQNCLAVGN